MKIFRGREYWLALWTIFAAALALRLWGIWFGLPFSYANDEYHEVKRALELGMGSFNLDRTGKGGLYYLLFLQYGVYFVLLKLAGVVDSAMDFARHYVRDPSAFYLMGRVTVAIFGAINVLLVYQIARRSYSVLAGILAALFLMVDVLHVHLSHRISVDVVMTCLATASLLFAIKLAEGGSSRDYVWAALLAGLATTTKLPAILLVVPLLIAHAYHVAGEGGGPRKWLVSKQLWMGAGVFAVVLVATNPGILFRNSPLGLFLGDSSVEAIAGEEILDAAAERPNLYTYYGNALLESMGWPLLLIAIAGVAYALWRRSCADVILVVFASIFFFVISSTTDQFLYYPRYVLPVLVVLVILAGRLLAEFWPQRGSALSILALLIAVAAITVPVYGTVLNNYILIQVDTRTLAKEWIDMNLPYGARIFIEGGKIEPRRTTVPLQDTPETIERRIQYWKEREPKQAKYLEIKLAVVEGPAFDLELVPFDGVESLNAYRAMGIEYFVVRPDALRKGRRYDSEGYELIDELQSADDVTLMKRFDGEHGLRPGPTIEVYRLDIELAENTDLH